MSSHPPGTLILEPQVVIATGGSGSNTRTVTVKGAYQSSSAGPSLPQYPIAYPGMCPPNAVLQQNVPTPVTTYSSAAAATGSPAADPLKYAFQSWLPNQPLSISTVQSHELPGNSYALSPSDFVGVADGRVPRKDTKRHIANRIRMREARATETEPVREERLSVDRERARRTRSNESMDERDRRLRMGRERAKRKRDTEDHVTREARLKKNREAARDRRAGEALDERINRLERNREQARYLRANEDPEHKRLRQARERERVRIKRMHETPEEKAERRHREMEKKRIMRGMAPVSGSTSTDTSPSGATTTTIVIGHDGTEVKTEYHHATAEAAFTNAHAAAAAAVLAGDRKIVVPQVTTLAAQQHHHHQQQINLMGAHILEPLLNGQPKNAYGRHQQ